MKKYNKLKNLIDKKSDVVYILYIFIHAIFWTPETITGIFEIIYYFIFFKVKVIQTL